MYGLALCLPRMGPPQGLPAPREIPKTQSFFLTLPAFPRVTASYRHLSSSAPILETQR